MCLSNVRGMDALVLSYNRYHPLANHMIHSYDLLWPGHPFRFNVPYQADGLSASSERLLEAANVVAIESAAPIKSTVEALLAGRDDDEWVYWCIDDKYPVAFDTRSLHSTIEWLPSLDSSFQGVTLCRCRTLNEQWNLRRQWNRRNVCTMSPWGERFLHRKSLAQFWVPSFLRAGFIRFVFDRIPEGLPQAHVMDRYITAHRRGYRLPAGMKLLVSEENRMHFGESTSRGKLTANAVQSMNSKGLALPEDFVVGERYIGLP